MHRSAARSGASVGAAVHFGTASPSGRRLWPGSCRACGGSNRARSLVAQRRAARRPTWPPARSRGESASSSGPGDTAVRFLPRCGGSAASRGRAPEETRTGARRVPLEPAAPSPLYWYRMLKAQFSSGIRCPWCAIRSGSRIPDRASRIFTSHPADTPRFGFPTCRSGTGQSISLRQRGANVRAVLGPDEQQQESTAAAPSSLPPIAPARIAVS